MSFVVIPPLLYYCTSKIDIVLLCFTLYIDRNLLYENVRHKGNQILNVYVVKLVLWPI